MSKDVRVGEDPALVPIIDEMSRQLARIRQTLQELLAFARPPAPALATIAVPKVIERAMRLVTPHAEERGVAEEALAEDMSDENLQRLQAILDRMRRESLESGA